MVDNLTREKRSYIMSRIGSRNTKPELSIRKTLKVLGFTYQPRGIYGRPDFANRKEKIAVFVDGCFWHGCPDHFKMPTSNIDFWKKKIKRNSMRDISVNKKLGSQGWRIIRIWEHTLSTIR